MGGKNPTCPTLHVHGTAIEEVTHDEYLGDILSNDGKNSLNIKKRISRGVGLISQLMNILDLVSFGHHHLEIGLLLRESVIIYSILNNVEVWYGMTGAEIDEFESLDVMLLRKMMRVPISTPKVALYLELGLIPLGIVIKARRIRYLHYLLQQGEEKMLGRFFKAQMNNPSKADWILTVRQDLTDFNIDDNMNAIKQLSKTQIKKIVKEKSVELAKKVLFSRKECLSKLRHLNYTDLQAQSYLTLSGFRFDEVRTIFLYRVRMYDFGENYRGSKASSICPLCNGHPDRQELMIECKVMREFLKGEYSTKVLDGVYSNDVPVESMEIVLGMLKFRENMKGRLSQEALVHQEVVPRVLHS